MADVERESETTTKEKDDLQILKVFEYCYSDECFIYLLGSQHCFFEYFYEVHLAYLRYTTTIHSHCSCVTITTERWPTN